MSGVHQQASQRLSSSACLKMFTFVHMNILKTCCRMCCKHKAWEKVSWDCVSDVRKAIWGWYTFTTDLDTGHLWHLYPETNPDLQSPKFGQFSTIQFWHLQRRLSRSSCSSRYMSVFMPSVVKKPWPAHHWPIKSCHEHLLQQKLYAWPST